MRRLSTTTIGMMAWSKRVCVLLVVSLLFDLSVCLCRPECLSVTGLRFTTLKYMYTTVRVYSIHSGTSCAGCHGPVRRLLGA